MATKDGIKVKGCFRLQIRNEDGSIAGDSGWHKNQVANLGLNKYLCMALGSISGSLYVGWVGLGTGGLINQTDTTLLNEVGTRQAVTAASSTNSSKVRFTSTFAAGWHSSAAAFNISNIGLFNSSTSGSIFAGNTYASSSCASNQAVNVTYDVSFS